MRSVPRLACILVCALISTIWFLWPFSSLAQPPAPLPTLGLPPLALRGSASATHVEPGQSFSYVVEVSSSSSAARRVELRIAVDPRLEFVGAGPCAGGATVVCKLSVARDRPSSVAIGLRVRGDAPRDSAVALQALAQDDLLSTAASDRVTIAVVARQVSAAPTALPLPVRPTLAPIAPPAAGAAASAAQPAAANRAHAGGGDAGAPDEPVSEAPAAASEAGVEPAAAVLPAGDLAGGPALPAGEPAIVLPAGDLTSDLDTNGELGGVVPAVADAQAPQPLDAVAPPSPASAQLPDPAAVAAPSPPTQAAELWQGVPLPNTALLPRPLAWLAGLLGLALIIHGVRGARQTAAQIGLQARGLRRLAALGAALRSARAGDRMD
jgi:hypothetical protein